ncbi:antitoxin HipB [compost metagenome]
MNDIKHLRERSGITQSALAKQLGITQGAVAHYEAGRRTPSLNDCRRVVRALNHLGVDCSLSQVFPDQVESAANPEANDTDDGASGAVS